MPELSCTSTIYQLLQHISTQLQYDFTVYESTFTDELYKDNSNLCDDNEWLQFNDRNKFVLHVPTKVLAKIKQAIAPFNNNSNNISDSANVCVQCSTSQPNDHSHHHHQRHAIQDSNTLVITQSL